MGTGRQRQERPRQGVPEAEVRAPRPREVAHRRIIRSLAVVDLPDEFRDEEVEVGVTLAVRVGAQVDRDAVDPQGEVGAVIEVEAAEKVLVSLPAAGVLGDHDPGDDLEEFTAAEEGPCREFGGPD